MFTVLIEPVHGTHLQQSLILESMQACTVSRSAKPMRACLPVCVFIVTMTEQAYEAASDFTHTSDAMRRSIVRSAWTSTGASFSRRGASVTFFGQNRRLNPRLCQ